MAGPTDSNGRKVSSLRELPQSLPPGRDLWPGIEARLRDAPPDSVRGTGAPRGAPVRWLAAAAMVACVAVGVWIGRSFLPGVLGPGMASRVAPGIGPAHAVYVVTDPRYQEQHAALERSLQARLAALPPASRAKVAESLATIEKAKADLEQALGRDPGNALLQELLVNTYQDEMRVLTDVHEASDPGRGI